jgi:nucleotide-binding universal stress UspA family protein
VKVLLAADGSPASDAACQAVARLFPGAEVLVLSVVEPSPAVVVDPMGVAGTTAMAESIGRSRTQDAIEAAARAATTAHATDVRLDHGHPVDRIAETADAEDVDVIVVGAEERGFLRRLLDPPVSGELIHRTARPVLVVHGP